MRSCLLFCIALLVLIHFPAEAQKDYEYKTNFPPALVSQDLSSFEISDQAFPFFDGALLIPDTVSLVYFNEKIVLEVLQPDEERFFEPLACFEFEDWFSAKDYRYKLTGDEIPKTNRNDNLSRYLFFKQRIWIKGMIYAAREYRGEDGARFRVDAFRVDFRVVDEFVRPSVMLYKRKPAKDEPEDGGVEMLNETLKSLAKQLKRIEEGQKKVIERLDQTSSACEAILQKLNEVSDLVKPRSVDEGGADKEEE